MKHRPVITWLLLAGLLVAGCAKDPQKKGPEATAYAFLNALAHGDYEKARTFCTPGTRKNLSMFETFSGFGANPFAKDFTVTRVEESGNYATAYYTSAGEKDKRLQLRNEDGRWEVIARKADIVTDKDDDASDDDIDLDLDTEDETETDTPADEYRVLREGLDAESTARAFLSALHLNDFDKAKTYASESTAEMLDFKEEMVSGSEKPAIGEFEITGAEDEGESARVTYREDGKEKVLKLQRDRHGNWEVIMTKSDFDE